MKIYMATWLFDKSLGTSLTKLRSNQRLLSFHFLREQEILPEELIKYCCIGRFDPKQRKAQKIDINLYDMSDLKVELFLDSGAYSAATQNKTIDVHEYIRFIKENESVIHIYANLDVIGDDEATWKNQQIIESAGLHPLPVYHVGDNPKFLDRCINEYEYFCLGGMAKSTELSRVNFLDECWLRICNTPDHKPRNKVHGFGLTAPSLMRRYPWFSVDSTSWVVTGRMGSIYIPQVKNGSYDYTQDPHKIAVSNRSPGKSEKDQHILTIKGAERAQFLKYIHEEGYELGESEFFQASLNYHLEENENWGKKPGPNDSTREVERIIKPGITNKYQLRDEMNILFFKDLAKTAPVWPWPYFKKNDHKVPDKFI